MAYSDIFPNYRIPQGITIPPKFLDESWEGGPCPCWTYKTDRGFATLYVYASGKGNLEIRDYREELKQMAEETGDSSLLTPQNIYIVEVREQPTAALLMDTVNNWLQEIGES